jgi:DNA-binding XRE family transcriptional regulator
MASLLGIHENTYRSWEKNPRHISVINAYKISDILNVGIDEIKFCEEPNQ